MGHLSMEQVTDEIMASEAGDDEVNVPTGPVKESKGYELTAEQYAAVIEKAKEEGRLEERAKYQPKGTDKVLFTICKAVGSVLAVAGAVIGGLYLARWVNTPVVEPLQSHSQPEQQHEEPSGVVINLDRLSAVS